MYVESAVIDLNHGIRLCLNDRPPARCFLKLALNRHFPVAKQRDLGKGREDLIGNETIQAGYQIICVEDRGGILAQFWVLHQAPDQDKYITRFFFHVFS